MRARNLLRVKLILQGLFLFEGTCSGVAWLDLGSKDRVHQIYSGVKSAHASFTPE